MNNVATKGWEVEGAVELMKAKYLEGLSAAQISRLLQSELGVVVTRNAVIGKAHRLGLTATAAKHNKPAAPRLPKAPMALREPAPRRTLAKPVVVAPPPMDGEPAARGRVWSTPDTAAPFLEVGQGCKFPVGAATGAELVCCGAKRAPGDAVYCADHRTIAGGAVTPLHLVKLPVKLPRFARW